MNKLIVLSALLMLHAPFQACATTDTYWEDRSRGWFWYEDPEEEREAGEAKADPVPTAPGKRIQDMKNAAEIRAEIQRLLDIASANPTKDNVKAFMEANKYSLDKAAEFTSAWSALLRENPALDSTIENPVNALAMATKRQIDTDKQSKHIASLASSKGLFFFFRGDCKYCHAFAPTLARFSQQYGIEVFPVSLDGGKLPEYQHPSVNNGMAENLGVSIVPAVFLGDKHSGQVLPIGYGVMSLYDLVEKIYAATTEN